MTLVEPNSFLATAALRDGSMWKKTESALTEFHIQARCERPEVLSDWMRQLVSSP